MRTLTEISAVRQIPGEPRRRWFRTDDLDLIVWCDAAGAPMSFQLCYDKLRSERALTWTPERGFLHTAVDDGEDIGLGYKQTPILLAGGQFDANRVGDRFAAASAQLPREIAEFVGNKLKRHPDHVRREDLWKRPSHAVNTAPSVPQLARGSTATSEPPMAMRRPLTQFVESYRFWDVTTLWARERVEHENVVASALARGVICDGLRLQSVDDRWIAGNDRAVEFKGFPYVGYRADPKAPMCVLRASALDHLLGIVNRADVPSREKLSEEFILRKDFRAWLNGLDLRLPTFWFGTAASRGL
jgi:hypothetical protein